MKEINKRDIILIVSIILIILIVAIIIIIPKNGIDNKNNSENNTVMNGNDLNSLPFIEFPRNIVDENGQRVNPANGTGTRVVLE